MEPSFNPARKPKLQKPPKDACPNERLAAVVARRQLLQKVLRSWHSAVQVQHQKAKLAKLFHLSRLVSAVLANWRKVIAGMKEKRKVKKELNGVATSQLQHKKTLRMWAAFKYAIQQCMLEKERVERLMEIKMLVSERLRVIHAFNYLKKGTRGQKAGELFLLKTESKVWNALVVYSREKARKRAVNNDIEDLC